MASSLNCAMAGCRHCATYIDKQGNVYCREHAFQRYLSVACRCLLAREVEALSMGANVTYYSALWQRLAETFWAVDRWVDGKWTSVSYCASFEAARLEALARAGRFEIVTIAEYVARGDGKAIARMDVKPESRAA